MVYVLMHLKRICQEDGLTVKCVPTSYQSKMLAIQHKVPITDLDMDPIIDVAIDGADEVDENLVAIKGGGACLLQERVVAYSAQRFVLVADHRKNSKFLGERWHQGIPIEVLPMACNSVRYRLSREFSTIVDDFPVRIAKDKAGPVITDNGNMIIDWKFKPDLLCRNTKEHWRGIADQIKNVPGVLETGLFANIVKEAYFGYSDATVLNVNAPTATRPKSSQLFTGN